VPASPPSSGVRVAAAVTPCTRDPRIRTDLPLDPRLQPSVSFHQTAVVLPTQAKPSSTVTSQSDTGAPVEQTDGSGVVENIFDRLLRDFTPVKSQSVAVPRTADSVKCSAASGELKTDDASVLPAESCVGNVAHDETAAAARILASSPKPAAGKSDDIGTDSVNTFEVSSQQMSSHSQQPSREEIARSVSRHSCDVAAADENDADVLHQSRAKSGRRRAASEDRDKSAGRLTADVAQDKNKDTGPAAKRMRNEGHPPDSVPTEVM